MDRPKKSSGELSSTCRICVIVKIDKVNVKYVFVAKILPPDDSCRIYVFETKIFEKEISMYFELLPCIRQFLMPFPEFETFLADNLPTCIYGSNNGDGAGVLVFECAAQAGYLHPMDPEGLSLSQLKCTVRFIAKFHGICSALLIKKGGSLKLRYPFLESNMYASPLMIEGVQHMFDVYSQIISTMPGQSALHERFEKLRSTNAPTTMYQCMRRQVT